MPIILRCGQDDGEGTVGLHHGRTERAARALHGHGCTGLATPCELGTRPVDDHVGRRNRRLYIDSREAGAARRVAGRIGLAHGQYLAIELRRDQVDAEHATGIHHPGAEHVVGGVAHGHRSIGLTGTGEYQAIGGQAGHQRVGRWRDVGGLDEGRLRFAAHQCHRRHAKVLAVELRRVQLQGEGAIECGAARADQVACGIVHADADTARRVARQGQAVAAQGHVGGRHRRCQQWRDIGRDRRGVEAVRLRHRQRGKAAGCRHQGYLEVAGSIHLASAQHDAAAADGDRRIGFAFTGQHVEGVVDGHVRDHGRRRGVVGLVAGRQRGVAGIVGGHHGQQLAIVLGRVEGDGELAVFRYLHRADHRVVWPANGDGGACFGSTRHRGAGRVEQQVGRL
ncbi:hypothetical protein D3C76_274910 [compost metagenome]